MHPKNTVPDALHDALFGQPEPSEVERAAFGEDMPPLATYAVLDAAKMPYLLTSLLESSGLRYQSLFQGQAQEELGEHAPYLVELKDSHDFTRRLFTGPDGINGLWEKELGIFIRSRASFDALRKHLRKFTRVQDEEGKWFLWRFWEGEYLSGYIEQHSEAARAHIRYFLGTAKILSAARAENYVWTASVTKPSKIPPGETYGAWPNLLDDLGKVKLNRFKRNLPERLSQSFAPLGDLNPKQRQQIVGSIFDHALSIGLDNEEAIETYCTLWLIVGQPPENYRDLRKILDGPQHQIDRTKNALRLVESELAKQGDR